MRILKLIPMLAVVLSFSLAPAVRAQDNANPPATQVGGAEKVEKTAPPVSAGKKMAKDCDCDSGKCTSKECKTKKSECKHCKKAKGKKCKTCENKKMHHHDDDAADKDHPEKTTDEPAPKK